MYRARALVTVVVATALFAGACSDSLPAAPTVVSPALPTAGALSCPANIRVTSADSLPVHVTFNEPTVPESGSQHVEKGVCSPGSGSSFPVGSTAVSCEVKAEDSVLAACSFSVTVSVFKLSKTTFLAFGDSITEGIQSLSLNTLTFGSPRSYPGRLQELLDDRYPDQTISVLNSGVGGEETREGRARLAGELDRYRPDVLLLLEGVNDLDFGSASNAANNLRAMVQSARARSIAVIIATLTPVTDHHLADRPGLKAAMSDLNGRIREIAIQTGSGHALEMFPVFENDLDALLSRDGIHPNNEGYRRMAAAFFEAIKARFETLDNGPAGPARGADPRGSTPQEE